MVSRTEVANSVLERLKAVVGPKAWIEDESEKAAFLADERDLYHGASPPLVLRLTSTTEVARIIRICADAGVAVVPQGGNTSYVGGSVPREAEDEVVVSLSRLNRVRAIDPFDLHHDGGGGVSSSARRTSPGRSTRFRPHATVARVLNRSTGGD